VVYASVRVQAPTTDDYRPIGKAGRVLLPVEGI